MPISREEILGPLIIVIPYRDEEDAVAIASDSDADHLNNPPDEVCAGWQSVLT